MGRFGEDSIGRGYPKGKNPEGERSLGSKEKEMSGSMEHGGEEHGGRRGQRAGKGCAGLAFA